MSALNRPGTGCPPLSCTLQLDDVKTFLCIGAHCDDIEWASGGLFARLVRQGARGIYAVAVENPYVAEDYQVKDAETALSIRREEARQGARELGASRVEFFHFKSYYLVTPDREVIYPAFRSREETEEVAAKVYWYGLPPVENAYCFPECVSCLRSLIAEEKPDLVVTHPTNDIHQDHYNVSRFVHLVVRDMIEEGFSIATLTHEPGGLLGLWRPTMLVELSEEDLAAKERAYACFPSQHPHGRGRLIRDLAERSGQLGGVPLAEGYVWGGSALDPSWKDPEGFHRVVVAASAPMKTIYLREGCDA